MPANHNASATEKASPNAEVGADNRRIAPRIPTELTVSLSSEHNLYMGFSENISEGGLFVATHQILAIGTRLEVTFTLPTAEGPMTVVGEVRWTRGADAAKDDFHNYGAGDGMTAPGMGLRFLELAPETDIAIRAFLKMRDPVFYDD